MSRPIKFRVWDGYRMWFDVDPRPCAGIVGEIMQFTGLHDKNGKEIWEGDVEDFGNGWNYKIIYSVIHGKYLAHHLTQDGSSHFIEGEVLKRGEVLGNIYENGELLK